MGTVSGSSDISRLLSLFLCSVCIITLVVLGALDAELGDQHSAVEKRRRMGLSIYVSSLDWKRDSSILIAICVLAMTAGMYFIVRARGVERVVGALCSLLTVQALLLFPSSVREMSEQMSDMHVYPRVSPVSTVTSQETQKTVPTEFIDSISRHSCFTFPSAQERLQYYMGGWARNESVLLHRLNRSSILPKDRETTSRLCHKKNANFGGHYLLDASSIQRSSCWREQNLSNPLRPPGCNKERGIDVYLRFALNFLNVKSAKNSTSAHHQPPGFSAIFELGDTRIGPTRYPVVVKSRAVARRPMQGSMLPVLWPLNKGRHWGWSSGDLTRYHRPPWSKKRDVLVFRGDATGGYTARYEVVKQWIHRRADIDVGFSGPTPVT